ncbi:MAG: hypothetical protein PG981_001244 [Wolbachia endosymbiont of Ctenocephalides orientis wCori]|nr:MAG: hypothetical protein PG981_001244 [Wolbachia endosymbiont of Ctenocephalides orientis wCori]
MENSDGKTAAMLDINDGNNGKIEEAIYSFSLESENFDILQQLIDGLVKAYQETKSTIYSNRKEYGIQSLNIFNMKNSQKQNAVMLAAKHDLAALLKVWYEVPDRLTKDKYLQEEFDEVYALREASYITQDNNGRNALMLAVKSGNLECSKFLLSPKTATEILNQKDKNENTALRHAIESGNYALVEEFLRVVEGTFNGVNKYYPNKKVTLVIDDNMSYFINFHQQYRKRKYTLLNKNIYK